MRGSFLESPVTQQTRGQILRSKSKNIKAGLVQTPVHSVLYPDIFDDFTTINI